jgi:hypothetical protein
MKQMRSPRDLRRFDRTHATVASSLWMLAFGPESSLRSVYNQLMLAPAFTEQPAEEDWYALVDRISVPDRINEITEDAFRYFLYAWPPRLLGQSHFGFAQGEEPLRLFWISHGRFFCRQLTREETNRLCDASGLPREYAISLS